MGIISPVICIGDYQTISAVPERIFRYCPSANDIYNRDNFLSRKTLYLGHVTMLIFNNAANGHRPISTYSSQAERAN